MPRQKPILVYSILSYCQQTTLQPQRWQVKQDWDQGVMIGWKLKLLPQCMQRTIAFGGYRDIDYHQRKLE